MGDQEGHHSPEEKLAALGLTLPQPNKGIAVYKPVVVVGNLAYTSGQIPIDPATSQPVKGKLGDSGVPIEEGYHAARLCVRTLLTRLWVHFTSADIPVAAVL